MQAQLLAGFSVESAQDNFEMTEAHEPVTIQVRGHLGELETFLKELREAELSQRTRKSLCEIIYGSYNKEPFFTIYNENETKIMSR